MSNILLERIPANLSKQPQFEGRLYVLRRWNSFTPVLPTSDSGPGGGYFFCWSPDGKKRKGIVIDPGFDFLKNFQKVGLQFHAIDAIILTHSHIDHVRDFESILTGVFERNDTIKRRWPRDTQYIKPIDLFLSADSYSKFDPVMKAQAETTIRKGKVKTLTANTILNEREDYGLIIEVLGASHGSVQNPWLQHAVSIILRLYSGDKEVAVIGFTSDAKPSREHVQRFAGCDVVIGHLGTATLPQLIAMAKLGVTTEVESILDEFEGTEICKDLSSRELFRLILGMEQDDTNTEIERLRDILSGNPFYLDTTKISGHLQFWGLYNLMKEVFSAHDRASLGIISEFGLELGSLRHKVAKALNSAFFGQPNGSQHRRIITGDIGLVVRITPQGDLCQRASASACSDCKAESIITTGFSIRCIECGKFVPLSCIEDLCVRHREREIVYYCPGCLKHEFAPPQPLISPV